MANISRIIGVLGKIAGTEGQLTIKNKGVLKALAKEAGLNAEKTEKVLSVFKHPQVDVAYKAVNKSSANVSAVLRDGKAYIGDASAAIRNLGTEKAAIKAGLNIGEAGKYIHFDGAWNMAKPADFEALAFTMGVKDGVMKYSGKLGEFAKAEASLDYKKSMEKILELMSKEEKASALKEGVTYEKLIAKVNETMEKINKPIKEFLAGKEVTASDLNQAFGKKSAKLTKLEPVDLTKVKDKFGKGIPTDALKDLKKVGTKKISPDLIKAIKEAKDINPKNIGKINPFELG